MFDETRERLVRDYADALWTGDLDRGLVPRDLACSDTALAKRLDEIDEAFAYAEGIEVSPEQVARLREFIRQKFGF